MSEERARALRNGAIGASIMFAITLPGEIHRGVNFRTAIAPIWYAVVGFSGFYQWSLPARLEDRLSLNRLRVVPAMVRGALAALALAAAFGYFAGEFHQYVEWRQVAYLAWAAGLGAWIANLVVNLQQAEVA